MTAAESQIVIRLLGDWRQRMAKGDHAAVR